MTDDIDALAARMEEAAQGATPGPWCYATVHRLTDSGQNLPPHMQTDCGDVAINRAPWTPIFKKHGLSRAADSWHAIHSNPANVLAVLADRARLKQRLEVAERDKELAGEGESRAGHFAGRLADEFAEERARLKADLALLETACEGHKRRADAAEARARVMTETAAERTREREQFKAENERLTAERDEAIKLAYPNDVFDPTKRNKESYKLLWETACEMAAETSSEAYKIIDTLRARVRELEAALKPFSEASLSCEEWCLDRIQLQPKLHDHQMVFYRTYPVGNGEMVVQTPIFVADLRRARVALAAAETTKSPASDGGAKEGK